jgi:hypothetical protein
MPDDWMFLLIVPLRLANAMMPYAPTYYSLPSNGDVETGEISPILEFAYVLNARQPIIEKFGPYCFIGVSSLKIKPPLPID